MTRLNLLNRFLTVAAMVVLAVTLSVWLSRSSLTAGPLTPAGADRPLVPAEIGPETNAAPLPSTIAIPTTIEAPVGAKVGPTVEPTPKPHAICQPRRRDLFRRR